MTKITVIKALAKIALCQCFLLTIKFLCGIIVSKVITQQKVGRNKMTRIIIVRHGQSEANAICAFAGHSDFELSELGIKQANATAKYVVENYPIDKIYTSDLARAYNTALPISELSGIPLISSPELREIYAGDWEGVNFDVLNESYPEDYGVWLKDIENARPTGGESVREMASRVSGAVREIAAKNDGKNVVIVSHGTPIRALLSLFIKRDLSEMKNLGCVTNESVSVAEYENGVFELVCASEDKHLEGFSTGLPANV